LELTSNQEYLVTRIKGMFIIHPFLWEFEAGNNFA
jgi:hypothetical protein